MIKQLRNRIAIAQEPEKYRLRAELAVHLARAGEDVTSELAELRQRNLRFGDPILSVWIHVADGVRLLTDGLVADAEQGFARARAVALAIQAGRELSVVDSWQAYIQYTKNDILGAIKKLAGLFAAAGVADKTALGRAMMLVGQMHHFSGSVDLSRPWYVAARDVVLETGDQGLHSALLFNMASHHVCNYRHHVIRGSRRSIDLDLLRATVESVKNYDDLVGIDSLKAYEVSLLASVHLFNERYSEALALYQGYLAKDRFDALSRMSSLYISEMAVCAASLGDSSLARRFVLDADSAVSESVHIDDIAATRSRLSQALELVGDTEAASRQRFLAEGFWLRHEEFQGDIRRELAHQLALSPQDLR